MAKSSKEKPVKTAIKRWLDKQKFYHFSPIGGAFSAHGVPDIIVCARGDFIGIECKAPGREGTVTPNQQYHIDRINAAGGHAFVASSLDDVVDLFGQLGLV